MHLYWLFSLLLTANNYNNKNIIIINACKLSRQLGSNKAAIQTNLNVDNLYIYKRIVHVCLNVKISFKTYNNLNYYNYLIIEKETERMELKYDGICL